ncbi:MAG: efflux RND transporter periplasmic adaptor subunit [Chlorobiales bacterium]|jgi:RND family efflux transporter MFP subunit|nr:efflux RND transporter periplasmic adaptor subunit [Chlorobiales bacterium]
MQKTKVIVILVLVIGAVAGILWHNKTQMQSAANTAVPKLSAYPVSVTTVKKASLKQTLSLVGTIVANNDVAIISETQGRVTGINAEVGDWKEKGATLVQIDDELKLANFKTAKVNYEKSKKDYERYQSLHKDGAVSDAQLETARQSFEASEAQFIVARRQYTDTKITTPISGVVTSRPVNIGAMVQPGTAVANVVDISHLKVQLGVPEQDVFKLKAGDKVEVTTDVYPEAVFEGRIKTISAKSDNVHNYPVEIALDNDKKNPLKAGMFGRVSFVSIVDRQSLIVPRDVLVGSVKSAQVFVVQNGVAKLRNITVGQQMGTSAEILNGLSEGETVVLSGQNNIRDNQAVAVVDKR